MPNGTSPASGQGRPDPVALLGILGLITRPVPPLRLATCVVVSIARIVLRRAAWEVRHLGHDGFTVTTGGLTWAVCPRCETDEWI
jgi:hypothetical protein